MLFSTSSLLHLCCVSVRCCSLTCTASDDYTCSVTTPVLRQRRPLRCDHGSIQLRPEDDWTRRGVAAGRGLDCVGPCVSSGRCLTWPVSHLASVSPGRCLTWPVSHLANVSPDQCLDCVGPRVSPGRCLTRQVSGLCRPLSVTSGRCLTWPVSGLCRPSCRTCQSISAGTPSTPAS